MYGFVRRALTWAVDPVMTITDAQHFEDGISDAYSLGFGRAIPVGYSANLNRDDNGVASFGAVSGTEYAVGIYLNPMTISQVGIRVGTGLASSAVRVGFRYVDAFTGLPGAPVIDASFDTTTSGDKLTTLGAAVALIGGLYALTWVRQGGASGVSLQRSASQLQPLTALAVQTSGTFTAGGHGPLHGIINTGNTSGALIAGVTLSTVITNQEGNVVPAIMVTRSA